MWLCWERLSRPQWARPASEGLAVPRMASVWSCDSGCLFFGLSGMGSLVPEQFAQPSLSAQGGARRKHRRLCAEWFVVSWPLYFKCGVIE